jgi:thioredoxin-related protein
MFSCKEVSRRISESMDRGLPLQQRMFIRFHIMMCKYCYRFRKQLFFLKQMGRFSQSLSEAAGSALTLSDAARERIKNSLKAAH